MGSRVWGVALSLVLVLPGTAFAGAPLQEPEPGEDSSVADDNPARAVSRAHFESGLAAYEAGNYPRAITQWTKAHELMGSVPALAGPRQVLGLDLGQAHLRAYDRDHAATHLHAARPLLESYISWVDRTDHDLTALEREDRPRAVEMLARIDSEVTMTTPAPRVEQSSQPAQRRDDPPPPTSRKKARGLIIAGSVTLGIAVLAATTVAVPMRAAIRAEYDYETLQAAALQINPLYPQGGPSPVQPELDDADRRGKRANAAVLALATISAVTLLVGAPLLACGLVARKRNISASPTLSRGYAGGQLALRF